MKKKKKFSKKFENLIRNILQQEIWIYNVKRIHNVQNHGLVHFDANYPFGVKMSNSIFKNGNQPKNGEKKLQAFKVF